MAVTFLPLGRCPREGHTSCGVWQGSADAEHKDLKEGLAKALAKARDLTKVSGIERFGFVDVKVIKVRGTANYDLKPELHPEQQPSHAAFVVSHEVQQRLVRQYRKDKRTAFRPAKPCFHRWQPRAFAPAQP